jgi:hypothetical protein
VLDCGPGLGGPGARAALAEADQAVLVVEPQPTTAGARARRAAGAGNRSRAGVGDRGATGVRDRGVAGAGDRGAAGVRDRGMAEAGNLGVAGASRWVAHALANQGLPAVAVPWPAPAASLRPVAEALVADWTALGITLTHPGDPYPGGPSPPRTGNGDPAPQPWGLGAGGVRRRQSG